MKRIICAICLALCAFLGGWNTQKLSQSPIENIEAGTKTVLDSSTEAGKEAVSDADELWQLNALDIFNFSYQSEKTNGGYALSNEDLADLNYNTDFVFDLSDLKYDVVKALVKEIYIKNHYTSYEFYEHIMEVDDAMHQETGVEDFNVIFNSNQYWFIYYCQGKAYASFDDTGILSRARSAEALSRPGEDVLYGFPFKNSSLWMVICTKGIDRDYLVCRIGNPADKSILLEYPQDLSDSWKYFTFTTGYNRSEDKPQNGDVMFKQSLAYGGDEFIYTISEEEVYEDGRNNTNVSFLTSNIKTGEVKKYEGKGEISDTVGTFDNRLSEMEKLKTIQEVLQ